MKKLPKPIPKTHTFVAAYGSYRFDQLLALEDCIKSRAVAQKLIENGSVLMNGKPVIKVSIIVPRGTTICVTLPSTSTIPTRKKSSTVIPVLYEDSQCMVIDKPPHVAVHPGTGMASDEETILNALQPLFSKRKLPFSPSEVLVHRLDRDTTGCLLIAKTPKAHLALQQQFSARTVLKKYFALVYGVPTLPTATIDSPIGRHSTERTKMSVHRSVNPRSAQTTYRILAVGKNVAFIECDLHTGRTHQIRVHLSSIGHPILGDTTYGTRVSIDVSESIGIPYICLHAGSLSFRSGRKTVHVEAPIPLHIRRQLRKLGIKDYT